jgi:hypothetical protein
MGCDKEGDPLARFPLSSFRLRPSTDARLYAARNGCDVLQGQVGYVLSREQARTANTVQCGWRASTKEGQGRLRVLRARHHNPGHGAYAGNLVLGSVFALGVDDNVLRDRREISWSGLNNLVRVGGTKRFCKIEPVFEM